MVLKSVELPSPRQPLPVLLQQHLNEEQLKLLETKPLLEFALAEHERVRTAMETVAIDLKRQAAEQAEADVAPPAPPSHAPPALSIPAPEPEQPAVLSIPTAAPDANALAAADTRDLRAKDAAVVAAATETVGVSTEPVNTEDVGAQTEVSGPPPPAGLDPAVVSAAVATAAALALEEKEKASAEAEARGVAAGRAEAAAGVSKILRLLHVASRFQAKGERLPTAVDFFSKVGGGLTVIPRIA